MPSKSGSPRETRSSSPAEVTSSSAGHRGRQVAVATPEPWVAVATAPATEMCGSEARLCRASPAAASRSTSAP